MLGVLPFKSKISLLFSSDFDKIFIHLLEETLDCYFDEPNYGKLINILDTQTQKHTRTEIFEIILKNIDKNLEWAKALRAIMLIHRLTHHQGEEILHIINSKRVAKLHDSKISKGSKNQKHFAILPYYFSYLEKLANNYSEFAACFSSDSKAFDQLTKDNSSLCNFLSKAQDVLSYLLKIFPIFEASFLEPKPSPLLRQAAHFCLTDAYHFYTFINHLIGPIIREIFNISKDEALVLNQIYSEHINITKKLTKFFELKNHLTDFYVDLPEFYTVDATLNTEIELYISSIKKEQFRKRDKNSLDKYITEPDAHAKEIYDNTTESTSNPKSLTGFSKNSLHGVASLPVLHDKDPYTPPKCVFQLKRKTPSVKIKICKPTDKAPHEKLTTPPTASSSSRFFLSVPSNEEAINPAITEQDDESNTSAQEVNFNCKGSSNTNYSVTLNQQTQPVSIALLVPKTVYIPSGAINRGSCRSMEHVSPNRSLGGSFVAPGSLEHLS